MNSHISTLVIVLGSCLACAQIPDVVAAQETTTSDTRTLGQVKAAGALRSSYRKPIPQAKTYESPQANLKAFRTEIEPTLKKACYMCHGSEAVHGRLIETSFEQDALCRFVRLFEELTMRMHLPLHALLSLTPLAGLHAAESTKPNIVVFLADDMGWGDSANGPEGQGGPTGGSTGGLRGRKRDNHEGGIRVPGIVRWPGHVKPGTISNVPVIGSDIFATVLDVTGIDLPTDRTIDGVSMLPAFEGKPVEREIPLFWRTHVSPPNGRVALRIGDWKLVGNDTLTEFQLYEIQKDWKEERDLAASMPEKTEEMKKRLIEVWKEIESEAPDQ